VGAIRSNIDGAGLNVVEVIPRGWNTRRETKASSDSPAMRSTTQPRMSAPTSE
jgi:hypothetical protein